MAIVGSGCGWLLRPETGALLLPYRSVAVLGHSNLRMQFEWLRPETGVALAHYGVIVENNCRCRATKP